MRAVQLVATLCQLCKRDLQPHERPEAVCDSCLRANQTMPGYERVEEDE